MIGRCKNITLATTSLRPVNINEKPAIYGHNEESGYVRLLYRHLIEQNRHHFTVCADSLRHVLNTLRFDTLILLENECSSEIRHLKYILYYEMFPNLLS